MNVTVYKQCHSFSLICGRAWGGNPASTLYEPCTHGTMDAMVMVKMSVNANHSSNSDA